jgi:hypothetical protein
MTVKKTDRIFQWAKPSRRQRRKYLGCKEELKAVHDDSKTSLYVGCIPLSVLVSRFPAFCSMALSAFTLRTVRAGFYDVEKLTGNLLVLQDKLRNPLSKISKKRKLITE